MTTHETTTLTSETLLMIQSFRDADPDKRDRELSRQSFCNKTATAFVGSAHCWKCLGWLSKMINRLSVGGLRSA
jgi:hypothetical protein